MRITHWRPGAVALAAFLAVAAGPAGCRTDDVGPDSRFVGGRCTGDRDCVNRCLIDATAYPGGYCSVTCTANSECPAGAACVFREGGVCMATCRVQADCTDYGPGYQCTPQVSLTPGSAPSTCLGK